jgi:hypothetical protein
LVSAPAVWVQATPYITSALLVLVTTTDCAPVGMLDPRKNSLQLPVSPALSTARPPETAVIGVPPYVTLVAVSVEDDWLNTATHTPRGVPLGVCVQLKDEALAELAETEEASLATAIYTLSGGVMPAAT